MSYTNADLVRRHLSEPRAVSQSVSDQPVVLGESGYVRFYSGPVESGSIRVKSMRRGNSLRQTVALTNGAAVLATSPVAPGSVVVASDSSLGRIYEENVDFIVDYAGARISAKTGGGLGSDATVTVWLSEYAVYSAGIDYSVQADTGEIRRLAGGGIAPEETVLLDYTPLENVHDEGLIAAAVLEANGLVAGEIDPAVEFGGDPVLQAAATCLALSIICRASGTRALTANAGGDRAAVAWIKLAEIYAERGETLLRRFRAPHRGPSAPSIS